MKTLIPAVLALLCAFPLAAQNRFFDVTASVVWVDPTGNGSFNDLADPADIEFDGDLGYGASVNFFLSDRISIEIAASKTSPETTIRRRTIGGAAGDFDIVPITGVVQFHLAPNGTFDPYIGAGAAYVLFGDVDGVDDIQNIDVEDDVGLAVNAGLDIKIGPRWGIVLDGKYVPIESNASAIIVGHSDQAGRVDVSPIILSAGLRLRF